jgi:hypothetical protein
MLRALVDSVCSINLINQEVVLRWNLACDMQAARKPVASVLDDNPMRIWDAHSLSVTTMDSDGNELTSELQRYWAVSFVNYDAILGMQWLKATDPMVQWSSGYFIWDKIDVVD